MSLDIKKMNKLPPEAQFFDVNKVWYFFNGWVVRMLYPTAITPNQITFLSLVFGLLSFGFYVSDRPDALMCGALFLYGKEDYLPWDIVDHGYRNGFLWDDYQRGLMAGRTPVCDTATCHVCGIC